MDIWYSAFPYIYTSTLCKGVSHMLTPGLYVIVDSRHACAGPAGGADSRGTYPGQDAHRAPPRQDDHPRMRALVSVQQCSEMPLFQEISRNWEFSGNFK